MIPLALKEEPVWQKTLKFLRLLIPPLFLLPLRAWRERKSTRLKASRASSGSPEPFNGQGPLWLPLVFQVKRYAEWGMGASTEFVLGQHSCLVRSVETSPEWFSATVGLPDPGKRLTGVLVDLGPIGEWGRPLSYARRERIDDYLHAPFEDSFDPELVLIDGRFRVACFLAAVLMGKPGVVIVFDDYVGREHYHVVEIILRPVATAGRQAVFIRPDAVDRDSARALLADFKHVFD